ncbi:MAG: hypothetical protein AAF660_02320 [Pseudomonadota bacterium]
MQKTLPLVFVAALLSGCNSYIDLSCDKPAKYQQATESDRVVAPDGYDQLDLSREMPVPSAAAAKPRNPGDPCLDIPPRYLEEIRKKREADEQAQQQESSETEAP